MGRKKSGVIKCSDESPCMDYNTEPVNAMCPTLHKITASNEIHLFDLASLQLELERVLANIMERVHCLSAEAKGKNIPPCLLDSLRRRSSVICTDGNQTLHGHPSLIVKANPDKPLTLIISQRGRLSQHPQPSLSTSELPGSSRNKPFLSSMCIRRVSRSFEDTSKKSPPSKDKTQNAASYAIPNKFWELMEPYCAEITEANIAYLENLIRSYQDIETSYLLLPSSSDAQTSGTTESAAPASKRPRRDVNNATSYLHHHHHHHQTENDTGNLPHTTTQDANTTVWTRAVEVDLKNPIHDSSMLGRLSQYLLDSCYQDNVVSGFTKNITRILEEAKITEDRVLRNNHDNTSSTVNPDQVVSFRPSSIPDDCSCHFPVVQDNLRDWVTSKASQTLQAVAAQLHVGSSYRIEKKITQAMNELGLIPLTVNRPHLSDWSSCEVNRYYESRLNTLPLADMFSGLMTHPNSLCLKSPAVFQLKDPECSRGSIKSPVLGATSDAVELVNGRRTSYNQCMRSPVSASKNGRCSCSNNSDMSTMEIESGRRRNNVLKTDHAEMATMNGSVETGNSLDRLSAQVHSGRRKRKLRRSSHYRTPSPGIQSNGGDMMHDLEADSNLDSHLTSPKSTKDPLINGLLTTDEEEDETNFATDPLFDTTHLYDRSRSCVGTTNHLRRARRDDSPLLTRLTGDKLPSDSMATVNGDSCGERHIVDSSLLDGDTVECGVSLHASDSHVLEPKNVLNMVARLADDSERTETARSRKPSVSRPNSPSGVDNVLPNTQNPGVLTSDNDPNFDNALTFLRHECGRDVDPVTINISSCANLTNPVCSAPSGNDLVNNEVGLAIRQRQQELRLICAENLSVLRRLVQAARRDMQRQEIQRRLAIADADVIEAYNKLESYRPQRKPPLKRDRDLAYKALKERRKILHELELFDARLP